jgi:hypothetical protein
MIVVQDGEVGDEGMENQNYKGTGGVKSEKAEYVAVATALFSVFSL